MFALKKTNVM